MTMTKRVRFMLIIFITGGGQDEFLRLKGWAIYRALRTRSLAPTKHGQDDQQRSDDQRRHRRIANAVNGQRGPDHRSCMRPV